MTQVVVPKQVPYIGCAAECGNKVVDDPINNPIEGTGWVYLPITNRWRCVECERALRKINENKNAG